MATARAVRMRWLVPLMLRPCSLAMAAPPSPSASEHLTEVALSGAVTSSRFTVTTMDYTVPEVQLVCDDGGRVSLQREPEDGRAVVLNFIFTSCSSICPLSSQTLAQFQRDLGAERDQVHLVSISIDPEQDTPARLREYAKKFGAGRGWQHYTGSLEASLAAQRAFDADRGAKMSHSPVILLRGADDRHWRRIDGFITPDELLGEYRKLPARH